MDSAITEAGIERALENTGAAKIEADIVEVERLFIHWLEDINTTPRKLAKKSGVSERRVKEVLASGVFQKKYMEVQQGFNEVAEPYLKSRAQDTMQQVMGRLADIVEHGLDKDAIAAGRLIADLAGTKSSMNEMNINIDSRVLQIAADGLKDMDEVRRALSSQLDSNIIEATEIRTARRTPR